MLYNVAIYIRKEDFVSTAWCVNLCENDFTEMCSFELYDATIYILCVLRIIYTRIWKFIYNRWCINFTKVVFMNDLHLNLFYKQTCHTNNLNRRLVCKQMFYQFTYFFYEKRCYNLSNNGFMEKYACCWMTISFVKKKTFLCSDLRKKAFANNLHRNLRRQIFRHSVVHQFKQEWFYRQFVSWMMQ